MVIFMMVELVIFQVFWCKGLLIVCEVYEVVYVDIDIGYISVLKIMQNMLVKGLVSCSEEVCQYVYVVVVFEWFIFNWFVCGWMDSVFVGFLLVLVMQVFDVWLVVLEELVWFKVMIEKFEGGV